MIASLLSLLLAAQAAPVTEAIPLGQLPKQSLPARGCAAYLFSMGDTPVLVAMAGSDPAQIRFSLGGTITDLARAAQHGDGGFGFAGTTEYRSASVTATLDMMISTRADLAGGAAVQQGTLRVDRQGQDSVVLPVNGLIGCAPGAGG